MIQVRLPSGRLVPVNTDDPKVAAATARAFVAKDPYESTRAEIAKHPVLGPIMGAMETAARAVPGASEIQAALPAAVGAAQGKGLSESWDAARAQQQGMVDSFHADHPVISALTTGATMAAPIAAAIMTGGATVAPDVAAATRGGVNGVAAFLKPAAGRLARRAVTGGAAGAVYGASRPGALQDRLANADAGAATGAAIGAVVPPAVGAVVKGTGSVASGVSKTVSRAANKVSGGALLDPMQVATQRIVESLKADGATPDLVRTALNGFLKNGATDPTLIDVASRLPSGGQNTMALVRAAAGKGSGRGVAVTYGDQVAADLQDKAIARTQALTPDTRPAAAVRQEATDARGKAATAEYGAPYATTVDATPILPALEGDAGRVGIGGAYKDADALRLADQTAELAKLRSAAGPEEPVVASIAGQTLPESPALSAKIQAAIGKDDQVPVSLGTLDRVKIALNDAGTAAAKNGENSRAAGFFQRAAEIDDHLADQSPEYAAARDNYATASAGIDALDHGATGLNALPDDYAANLHDFLTRGGPDAGKMAAIGHRQALTDAIGAPTEGATGVLNRVATSTNQTRNLGETFAPEAADTYQQGVQDLIDQMNNARFINPNTNSASAGRLMDAGLVDPPNVTAPKIGPVHLVMSLVNKIRSGATLTDAERAAIAQIGTTQADPDALDLTAGVKLLPSQAMQDVQAIASGVGAGDDQRRKSQ